MNSKALIIFDIDGTLLETHRVTVPAVQRTMTAFGLPAPDAETICSFFGVPVEQYLDWLAAQCPGHKAQQIVDATNRLELDLIESEGRLYPGIPDVLATLKNDGYRLAICSNGPDDYVAEVIRAYRLAPLFECILTRGTRYDGKVSMVRDILKRIDARPVVLVGDRHDDIDAAHAHGAFAIAACYGFGNENEWRNADARVMAVNEIPAAISSLIGRG